MTASGQVHEPIRYLCGLKCPQNRMSGDWTLLHVKVLIGNAENGRQKESLKIYGVKAQEI